MRNYKKGLVVYPFLHKSYHLQATFLLSVIRISIVLIVLLGKDEGIVGDVSRLEIGDFYGS